MTYENEKNDELNWGERKYDRYLTDIPDNIQYPQIQDTAPYCDGVCEECGCNPATC